MANYEHTFNINVTYEQTTGKPCKKDKSDNEKSLMAALTEEMIENIVNDCCARYLVGVDFNIWLDDENWTYVERKPMDRTGSVSEFCITDTNTW